MSNNKLFYGWYIVLIVFMTSMITAGIGGYGLPFFLKPMSEEMGISRTQFSTVTIFRLAALPLIPFLGSFVDKRNGSRILISFGSLIAGLILMGTSLVHELWHFYLIYGVLFSIAQYSMGGMLVGPAILAKWFIKKRGRVMAISAMGISGGGFVIAPLAGWLVSEYGWRSAWVALGIVMIVSITPISALLMKRQPEDIGLLPDGIPNFNDGTTNGNNRPANSQIEEYPWTRKEAIRTKAMWILLGVQTLGAMSLMPVLLHQVPYIQDKDFSLSTAATVATTLAGFAILGKLVYGFLAERFPIRYVLSASLIPAGVSLYILVVADNIVMLYCYAIFHGLSMGGWPPLMSVALASYFGRQNAGAIRGIVTPAGNIVQPFTPVLAGWMWDTLGNYNLSFTIFAVSWSLAGILILFATPPKPPSNDS